MAMEPQTPHPLPSARRRGILPILFLVFGVAVVALIMTRWMGRKPPLPAASASIETKQQYWQERIKRDVADKDAYLNLGILQERTGFYLSARRNLQAARALGLPDSQVCGPLGRTLAHLAEPDLAQKELEKAVALAPGKWEPVANLAGFFVNSNLSRKADEVLVNFWKTVDKAALTSQELERLSLAFSECNDTEAALVVAQRLVAAHPDYVGGQILAARCAFTLGWPKEAKIYTEKALKETPNESAALYFYGLVLHRLNDYDGALKAWQKANQLNPTALDIHERIGREYARRGDYRRAAVALENIALSSPQQDRAIAVMQAYQKAGDVENANYWTAVAAGFQHDYKTALEFGQKVAASSVPTQRRRGLITMAEAYLGMGKKKEYLDTIFQATQNKTLDDLVLRARAYEVTDQYAERLNCLDQMIALDTKQEPLVRYQKSVILDQIGRRDEAETELERTLQLAPQNPTYAQDLARLYFKRNSLGDRLEKATRYAEQAVSLAPDQEESWMTLGQCYAAKNQLAKAARCMEHAIDLEPGNGPAYLELGRLYARMGKTPASKEMLAKYQQYVTFEQKRQTLRTKARRASATVAEIVEYADYLMNMGNVVEAIDSYEKAYARNLKDKSLRNTLRILYRRMGMTEKLESVEGAPQ